LTDWKAFHATSDRLETSFDLFTPLKRLFSNSPRRKLSLNKTLSLLNRGRRAGPKARAGKCL
jgi:hypothetical protein